MNARTRIAASAILAASVALGTAGCNLVAPQATLETYEPSDGVNGTTGDIDIRNAMLITTDGTEANLVVSLISADSDTDSHELTIQYEDALGTKQNATVDVAPSTVTTASLNSDAIVLKNIEADAGSLFGVYFQYDDEPGTELQVPVLTGDLADYSEFTPAPEQP